MTDAKFYLIIFAIGFFFKLGSMGGEAFVSVLLELPAWLKQKRDR